MRERAAGVDTLVLMAEMEEKGHIRIIRGDAGFPTPSRQELSSSCHLIRLMAFKWPLWQ